MSTGPRTVGDHDLAGTDRETFETFGSQPEDQDAQLWAMGDYFWMLQ